MSFILKKLWNTSLSFIKINQIRSNKNYTTQILAFYQVFNNNIRYITVELTQCLVNEVKAI